MARKSKTEQLTSSIAGQHVSLAVAAHLARSQLVPDAAKVYDGQHLSDMLDSLGVALSRTAPLYVTDAKTGEPRQLTPAELEGAGSRQGATQLLLKDGRKLIGVWVRRADLRQAIAVLKATGLPNAAPAPAPQPAKSNGAQALRARSAEIDQLLAPPLLPTQVERAKAAAVWMARHSQEGRIANLAMQLMSALHETRGDDDTPGGFRLSLARLRAALEETQES